MAGVWKKLKLETAHGRLKWWWSELKSSMAEVASLPYQPPAASASLPY